MQFFFGHKNRRKKLANLLLKNYIISFILMVFVILISSFVAMIIALGYFNVIPTDIHNPDFLMNENYKHIDSKKLEDLGGFILIIDKDYNILYSKGKVRGFDNKVSLHNLAAMINTTSVFDNNVVTDEYVFKASYNKSKNFMLLVAIPKTKYTEFTLQKRKITGKQFTSIAVLICIAILIIIFIIYSRITSRYFVKPVEKLIEGANNLAQGDFSSRIALKANNEFGELSDAFNIMAMKIEEERNLKEKSENQRKRLILDISHDLKNPLASIMGYANYLNNTPNLSNEDIKKYLSIIEMNSVRANSLIQDLFQFSKLESSDFILKFKNTDICEFLRELIACYIPQLEDKNFIYDFDIPEKSIYLKIDTKQLDRAFSNLILNCIKYNPVGTKFYMNLLETDTSIIISFEDDGIGIAKENLDTIFNPFVRVDQSRNSKSGGTGLGLAITKSVIIKHKGTINLTSEINKGCKFKIKLPK